MVEAVARALDEGKRIYWVCPLVEESEVSDLAAAEERFAALKQPPRQVKSDEPGRTGDEDGHATQIPLTEDMWVGQPWVGVESGLRIRRSKHLAGRYVRTAGEFLARGMQSGML